MTGWLERLTGKKDTSAGQAKERLKLVLIHDRTDLSPGLMESLKNDLLEVIARYIEIDPDAVRIDMAQDGREHRLVADIPLKASPARKKRAYQV
jgi:cell division topological specificity factor